MTRDRLHVLDLRNQPWLGGAARRLSASASRFDLLFYHRFLKALMAIELKIRPFEPEFPGKMDFYLNLRNKKERAPDDAPSIGIILCAEKDDLEVAFALKSKSNSIGVAEYHLQGKLPSVRQLRVVRNIDPPIRLTANATQAPGSVWIA